MIRIKKSKLSEFVEDNSWKKEKEKYVITIMANNTLRI